MSVDRTKVREAAQKFLAKGNYDRAIVELRKLVAEDPTDVRTWLKIGDLYTRSGSRREAIQTYARVADQYGDQGFFLKAVAVYKQILKLDPSRLEIQVKLAEMYEMLQLVSDALSTYEHVAAGYAKAGDIDQALDTLKKMTGLDPENIPVRIKAAEALSKAGRRDEAAEEFEAGAELLKEQGRYDDYLKVAERLLYHRPEDVTLARELAATYLERNDPKRALSKLQLCFKADPKDIATLELLAEAFNQLGQLPKTISVYKEVARIHQEANRGEERARILQRVLELDPGDKEARQGLASFAEGGARHIQPPASAVVAPAQPTEDDYDEPEVISYEDDEPEIVQGDEVDSVEIYEDEDEEILIVEDDMEAVEPEDVPPAEPRSVPPDVQREAQIARLLTECDVFMRYGLKQKVIEQLHAVLEIDPFHVEARERLKDLYIQDGRLGDAVAELLSLAEILSDDQSAAATLYLRQVLEIEPANATALAQLEQLGAAAPSVPPPAEAPAEDLEQRTVMAAEAFVDDEPLEDLAPSAPPPAPAAPAEDEVFFIDDESSVDVSHVIAEANAQQAAADAAEARLAAEAQMAAADPGVIASPPNPTMPVRTQISASAFPDQPFPDQSFPDQSFPDQSFPDQSFPDQEPESDRTQIGARGLSLLEDEEDLAPAAGGHIASTVVAPRPALVPPAAEVAVLNIPQPTAPGPLSGDPLSDPLAPMTPQEFESVPVRPSHPGELRPATSQRPPGEVEEVLDESDFFVAQGLLEEARGILTDALVSYPSHPLINEKLREIEQQIPAASIAPPPSEDDMDQSFELAEKLAGDFGDETTTAGSDVLDVEQVFAQFKKGVEAQVGMEDTETHFDLGIAYKEMGLLDDAINEFQLCLSNTQRVCISETMIGLCFIEKGELTNAITHFKKGLYADVKSDREELGLYYELGNAYDMLRDPKEAIYYFQKVQKREPDFRGVADRIQSLSQPHAAPVTQSAQLGQDDIDAAFDDLMGED